MIEFLFFEDHGFFGDPVDPDASQYVLKSERYPIRRLVFERREKKGNGLSTLRSLLIGHDYTPDWDDTSTRLQKALPFLYFSTAASSDLGELYLFSC